MLRLAIIVLLFLGGGMRSVLLTSQSGPGNSLVILLIGLFVAFAMVIGLHLAGFDAVAALRDRSLSAVPEAGMISDLVKRLNKIAPDKWIETTITYTLTR